MSELKVVGQPLPRVDAREKARGEGKYTVDFFPAGMLWGKILRSPYAHARILNIDTSQAERLPGVKAVIMGKETPPIRYAFVDTPRYPADQNPLAIDEVRYIGDEVAAVAAVDEETAEEALSLIRVDYEGLPAVFAPESAMTSGAPLVHQWEYFGPTVWQEWGAAGHVEKAVRREDNVSARTSVAFGDLDKGFRESDHVRQDRFETVPTAHSALEPHGVVAYFDSSDKLNVYLSSMGIFYKRYMLAKILGLPLSKVRILKSYVGGAFGGKIDLFSYEILAPLLARKTGKPVRIDLSREEVFTTTRHRHPTIIEIKTGVKRDGTIQAQDIKLIVDNGAYRGSGPVVIFLGFAFNVPVYRVPNYRYEGYAVYTNNPVRGPQRGHGAPQIRFAVDSQLDMIAHDLDLDLTEVMLKNAREKGEILPGTGDQLNSCGLKECIIKARQATAWPAKIKGTPSPGYTKKGIGISACTMFSGAGYYPFASAAMVKLHDDGAISLFTGATEMGQGCETTLSQVAAEVLGVSLEDIRVVSGDTELCPIDLGSFLSGGATVTGRAVAAAALDAREQLLKQAAEMLEANPADLSTESKEVFVKGSPEKRLSYREVINRSILRNNGNPVIGKGYSKPVAGVDFFPSLAKAKGHFTDAYGFAAQAAEVEVNLITGQIKVLGVTTFHDCGFPLNLQVVEGQIEGSVSMGLGQALSEAVDLKEGQLFNPSFLDYRLPTSLDSPPLTVGLVHSMEPRGPFGAKEAGEGTVAGVLAAVANAVFNATGVRIKSLPITPDKVLRELEEIRIRPQVR